jgi:FeS assembly SUF system regulator
MVRLSRLADYAVMVMTHIAQNDRQAHTAAGIAMATQLPMPTVAKILAQLRRADLLASKRGVKGGYVLAQKATAISAGAIVAAVDGPLALTQCSRPGIHSCAVELRCPSRAGLHRINLAMRKALDDMSLADIVISPPAFPEEAHATLRPSTSTTAHQ